jgi:geranylgeranyl pyrophosphate synthase
MTSPSETLPRLSDLQNFFRESRAAVDAHLDRLVPAETTVPATVHQAIRWSLFAGGKRFRPTLLLAVG